MKTFREAIYELIQEWKHQHNLGDQELTMPTYRLGRVIDETANYNKEKNRQRILYELQEQLKKTITNLSKNDMTMTY